MVENESTCIGPGIELLCDDAVGILTVRQLSEELKGQADFAESAVCGLVLLDYIIGYDRTIITDATETGNSSPATTLDINSKILASAFFDHCSVGGTFDLSVHKSIEDLKTKVSL